MFLGMASVQSFLACTDRFRVRACTNTAGARDRVGSAVCARADEELAMSFWSEITCLDLAPVWGPTKTTTWQKQKERGSEKLRRKERLAPQFFKI